MTYQRKTKDEWQIHVNYGYGDGWEHECTEETRKEGLAQLRCYRENCDYPAQMICRRVSIEQNQGVQQ